jgi:hypothetical protein
MTMRQLIAALGTIPQKLAEPEPLQARPLKPKPQKKVKPRGGGRPRGLTPAAIRSAKVTLKMKREGDVLKEVAQKRQRSEQSLKSELYRYRRSLREKL